MPLMHLSPVLLKLPFGRRSAVAAFAVASLLFAVLPGPVANAALTLGGYDPASWELTNTTNNTPIYYDFSVASDTSTLGGVISGLGGFTKIGGSPLVLVRANTYSGGTTLNAGTLAVVTDTSLGSGSLTINGGTLSTAQHAYDNVSLLDYGPAHTLANAVIVNGNFTLGRLLTLSGPVTLGNDITITSANSNTYTGGTSGITGIISGNHALTFNQGANASDAIILSGANTYSGGTSINAGLINFNSLSSFGTGSVTLNGGGLQWASGNTADISARLTALGSSGATFDTNGNDVTFASALSGSGSLTKSGSGSLTLSSANAYTGGTTLNTGTLGLGSDNAIGTGTLTINGGNLRAVGSARTLTNAVTLAGDFTLGRATNLAGAITLANNITLTSANPDTGAAGTSILGGVISGNYGLTFVDGANPIGTIILSGANTHTGNTTLQSGTLTLANSLALQNSTFTYSGGSLGFGSLTSATFGGLAGSQGLALANASSANVALTVGGNNANTSYSGVLSGGGSLVKTGSGSLTLSGAGTYSGGTTVNAGLITFTSADNFGSGSITLNGGGLQWASGSTTDISSRLASLGVSGATFDTHGNNVTFASALSGSGAFTKAGSGTLTLNAANTYTGATLISAGTLQIGAAASFGNTAVTVASGAVLDLDDHSVSLASIAGTGGIDLGSATLTSGSNNASTTFDGVLSGSGGLIKAGSGTLTLTGGNTYTGATTVSAGTLQIGSGASFGSTVVAVASGAVLDLDDHSVSLGSIAGAGGIDLGSATLTTGSNNTSTTFGGVISGSGGLVKTGSGTLTLTGANTHSGGTTINGGTLQIGNGGTSGSVSGNIVNNAALVFNRSDAVSYSPTISGTGSVTQSGGGTLTLTSANTYSGGTVLNAGILGLGADNAVGSGLITINGGNLRAVGSGRTLANDVIFAGDFTLGRLTNLTGNITLAKNIALTSANPGASAATTSTLSGVISGNYGLTFVDGTNPIGSIILSGANTYTGGTTLQSGTLTLANSLALQNSTFTHFGGSLSFGSLTSATFGGLAGTQGLALTNASAANVALTVGGNNANSAYSGVLSGGGSLVKTGTGTLTFSGVNTYSGGTTINAGLIAFTSADNFGSGSITLNGGGLQWASGSTADISSRLASLGTVNTTFNTNGAAITFASALSGSGALTKAGSGTLTLTGANTYTGGTTVAGGTLALSGGDNRLATNSTLYLTGGTLDLGGNSQTLAGLGSASNRLVGNIANGTVATTGYTYLQSGTYSNTWTGSSSTARLWIGGDSSATVTLNGTNDSVYTADHNQVIIGHSATGAAGTVKIGNANALAAATENVEVWSGTLDLNGQANVRANSIILASGSSSKLINNSANIASYAGTVTLSDGAQLGGNGQLTLSGDIIGTSFIKTGGGTLALVNESFFTNAAYPLADYGRQVVLSGGTLSLGGNTSSLNFGDYYNTGITADFAFSNNSTLSFSTSSDATFTGGYYHDDGGYSGLRFETTGHNITLTDAILTGYSLYKTGAGTLTLASTGTHSGYYDLTTTNVGGGTLVLSEAGQLGHEGFSITNGATLDLGGTTQTLSADTYSEISTGTLTGGTLSFVGELYVTGACTLDATFTGSGGNARLWIDDYSDGTVYLGGSNNRVYTTDHNQVIIGYSGAPTVKLLSSTALAAATENVEVWSGTLDLNGQTDVRAHSLVLKGGSAQLVNSSATAASYGGVVTLSTGSAQLGGTGNLALSGILSGTGGFTKVDTGTLTLSGTNTYTGATTVTTGKLVVNGSLANTVVTVASGATLGGSGSIGGLTTFASGGILAPGNSPGTLTFTNGLTLNNGAILDFQLGSSSDVIRVSGGTLTGPASGTITVNLADSGGFTAGTYTLIDATGASLSSIGATAFELGSSIAGYDFTFTQDGNLFLLTASAIPEPATFAALLGACALGLAALRRRFRA